MTVDEIKQSHSMCDIVESYDFHPNRAGFIPCRSTPVIIRPA